MRTFLGLALTVGMASASGAMAINVGTAGNAANWTIDSDTLTFGAFQTSNAISVTSNGTPTGTSPLNLATWDGIWKATLTFTLPANATNVALNTTAIFPDDKVILALNGVDFAVHIIQDQAAAGTFVRNGITENVTFTASANVTVTNGFILGGTNTLVAFLNNTDTVNPMAPSNFTFAQAGTGLTLDALVTFDVPAGASAPEPASALLIAAGLGGLMVRLRRG
jgi:hypothetical protein